MDILETISKNGAAFLGISVILLVVIVVAFLSAQKPFDIIKEKGSEKILRIDGSDAVLFEGTGCGCQADYIPVCGTDGRTYYSACFAQCANVGFTNEPCSVSSSDQCIRQPPETTLSSGNACGQGVDNQNTQCAPGLVCANGVCTGPTGVPQNGEACGAVEIDESGTGIWNPIACEDGLSCQDGFCRTEQNTCTPREQNLQCSETDDGNTPLVYGTITGLDNNNIQITREDTCIQVNNANKFIEYYCRDNRVNQYWYDCDNDCSQGICQGARGT